MKHLTGSLMAILILSFLFVSCMPQQTDVAEVKRKIEEMDAASIKAWKEKDVTAAVSLYAPDAMILPQNSGPISGKENIEASFKMWIEGTKGFNFTSKKVEVSGDLAYSTGEYTMAYQMPGMPVMADTGKYSTIYKRQPDGSWKIVVDMFNTNLPPPMMAMEEKKMDDKNKK